MEPDMEPLQYPVEVSRETITNQPFLWFHHQLTLVVPVHCVVVAGVLVRPGGGPGEGGGGDGAGPPAGGGLALGPGLLRQRILLHPGGGGEPPSGTELHSYRIFLFLSNPI